MNAELSNVRQDHTRCAVRLALLVYRAGAVIVYGQSPQSTRSAELRVTHVGMIICVPCGRRDSWQMRLPAADVGQSVPSPLNTYQRRISERPGMNGLGFAILNFPELGLDMYFNGVGDAGLLWKFHFSWWLRRLGISDRCSYHHLWLRCAVASTSECRKLCPGKRGNGKIAAGWVAHTGTAGVPPPFDSGLDGSCF